MAAAEDYPAPYHQQERTNFCGAACAQMLLAQLGGGLGDQTDLYNNGCHDDTIEKGWSTSPNGLCTTLNKRCPASFPSSFALMALESEDALSRKIVWTIHNYKTAAVALIGGKDHWVLVSGYEASAAPIGPDDPSYFIKAFDINDPAPALNVSKPPPHSHADICGTLGDGAVPDHHIPYSSWKEWMTGVPDGYWKRKVIAVCDADPPPVRIGKQAPAAKRLSGERIVTPEQARELALAGLNAYGLFDRPVWKKSLARTNPGEPILVQRLDRLDSFYYIVPMQVSRKVMPAVVCVDARFGDYLRSARLADPRGSALGNLNFDPKVAVERILEQPIDLGRHGRLVVRKEAYALYPTLVWRPCRESMSPYVPFFMVTVGTRRLYVRVDGRVFTKLHLNDRGI